MSIELSVVIPAYNEERSIQNCINTVISDLESFGITFEIIPVDDGSKDNTLQIIRSMAQKDSRIKSLTNGTNHGKGFTVRHGVLESQGEFVLFTDVDLSTPISEYKNLRAAIDQGYDIAIGSRALQTSSCGVRQPWYRVFLGRMANHAIQMIVPALRGIRDTQCGFKLFKSKAARVIFPKQRNERWGFDFEILHIAKKYGFRVIEVAINWSHSGDSHIRLSDYPKTFMELVQVRRNETKGFYETRE